jgi:hypothetical protein
MALKIAGLALFVGIMLGAGDVSYGQTPDQGVDYPSPAAAMQALRARSDIVFTLQNGWTVAEDRAHLTTWSFPPAGDPTYPTVVKRVVTQTGAGWSVSSAILCGGTQAACDKLSGEFRQLDEGMTQALNAAHPSTAP